MINMPLLHVLKARYEQQQELRGKIRSKILMLYDQIIWSDFLEKIIRFWKVPKIFGINKKGTLNHETKFIKNLENLFAKHSIYDVGQGSECTSILPTFNSPSNHHMEFCSSK